MLANGVVARFDEAHDRPACCQDRSYRAHKAFIGRSRGQPEPAAGASEAVRC
jgi:hypothetical protein